jgi:hypothetical protein
MYYGWLGEKDRAFEWLERAYEKHNAAMLRLKVEPPWEQLRNDPRFQGRVAPHEVPGRLDARY